MPQSTLSLSGTAFSYTIAATVVAASLWYVFGTSIVPSLDEPPRKRNAGAVGLANPGNYCFMNSVLQALAGSPRLLQALDTQSEPVESKDTNGAVHEQHDKGKGGNLPASIMTPIGSARDAHSVTKALKSTLEKLTMPTLAGRTISARNFMTVLETAHGKRISRSQQDAQELLHAVAEKLLDEFVLGAKAVHPLDTEKEPTEAVDQRHGDSTNPSNFPLKGTLTSTITCKYCSHSPAPTHTTSLVLTLPVPQDIYSGATTLDACLDGLLKQEAIEGYKCDYCSPPARTITKHTAISRYPEILALHLSRSIFSSSGTFKNTARVVFKESLRLGGLAEGLEGRYNEYKLVSVITHRGGHDSGHYETFRRQYEQYSPVHNDGLETTIESPDARDKPIPEQRRKTNSRRGDRWWAISDDTVRACSSADLLRKQKEVYILLYEKT